MIAEALKYFGQALGMFGELLLCILEAVAELFHRDSC